MCQCGEFKNKIFLKCDAAIFSFSKLKSKTSSKKFQQIKLSDRDVTPLQNAIMDRNPREWLSSNKKKTENYACDSMKIAAAVGIRVKHVGA